MIWHYKADCHIKTSCFLGLALLFSTKLQNFARFRTNLGDGYFTSTVGKYGNENMIGKYVKNQGKEYKKLHEDHQLAFF